MMDQNDAKERGERAEQVASWYFRLNGFLSIPGFIVHPDTPRHHPYTEADLIAVRFPYRTEIIEDRIMIDDPTLTRLANAKQILFILVEVKATRACNINVPWREESRGNMQRMIRRLGFIEEDKEVDEVAKAMYQDFRCDNSEYVFQYIAVGKHTNEDLRRRHGDLVQITWDEIGKFLYERFDSFPEKFPNAGPVHEQWPDFGRNYGKYFMKRKRRNRSMPSSMSDCYEPIRNYIETGRCELDKGQET